MSRKVRIEYPGAMYHVMNRGDQREDIFRDDEDRQRFLSTLGEACGKNQVAGACVLPDAHHFRPPRRLHLVSWTCVSNLLNEQPQTHPQAQEVLPLCQ